MTKVYDDGKLPGMNCTGLDEKISKADERQEKSIDSVVRTLENRGLALFRQKKAKDKAEKDFDSFFDKHKGNVLSAAIVLGISLGIGFIMGRVFDESFKKEEGGDIVSQGALLGISTALVSALGFMKGRYLRFCSSRIAEEKRTHAAVDASYDVMHSSLAQEILYKGASFFKSHSFEQLSPDHQSGLLIDYIRYALEEDAVSLVQEAGETLVEEGVSKTAEKIVESCIQTRMSVCSDELLHRYAPYLECAKEKDKERLFSYCEKIKDITSAQNAFGQLDDNATLLRLQRMYVAAGAEEKAMEIYQKIVKKSTEKGGT